MKKILAIILSLVILSNLTFSVALAQTPEVRVSENKSDKDYKWNEFKLSVVFLVCSISYAFLGYALGQDSMRTELTARINQCNSDWKTQACYDERICVDRIEQAFRDGMSQGLGYAFLHRDKLSLSDLESDTLYDKISTYYHCNFTKRYGSRPSCK